MFFCSFQTEKLKNVVPFFPCTQSSQKIFKIFFISNYIKRIHYKQNSPRLHQNKITDQNVLTYITNIMNIMRKCSKAYKKTGEN